MSRKPCFLTILCIWALYISAFAQYEPTSKDENIAMEAYGIKLGLRKDLHSVNSKAIDGSKGFGVGVPEIHRILRGDNGPYGSQLEADLHDKVCNADAVVVAKELNSSVHITDNKAVIYTKHEVELSRILKGSPNLALGKTISVAEIGGTVFDKGEKLRVDTVGLLPFSVGRSYLFVLAHQPDAPPNLFTPTNAHQDDNIRVIAGRIQVSASAVNGQFVSGETVNDIYNRIRMALAKAPCSR